MTSHPEAPSHDLIDPAILYFGTPVCLRDAERRRLPQPGAHLLRVLAGEYRHSRAGCHVPDMPQPSPRARVRDQPAFCRPSRRRRQAGPDDRPRRRAPEQGGHGVPHRAGQVRDRWAHRPCGHPGGRATGPRVPGQPREPGGGRWGSRRAAAGGGDVVVFEVDVVAVHVHPSLRVAGHLDRMDPDLWRSLIISFQQFYGRGAGSAPRRSRPSRKTPTDRPLCAAGHGKGCGWSHPHRPYDRDR